MIKIIGACIFLFGLVAVVATYDDLTPFWFDDRNEKIETLWKQDLELLLRNNALPKQWVEVSEIKFFPLSEGTKRLIQDVKLPFREHKEGDYLLEISLDDWDDKSENGAESGTEYGIMVQYNLINKKSGNTIWELGRTLIVK